MNALTQSSMATSASLAINLTDFIDEFDDELLSSLNRSNPPVYTGTANSARQMAMGNLIR